MQKLQEQIFCHPPKRGSHYTGAYALINVFWLLNIFFFAKQSLSQSFTIK